MPLFWTLQSMVSQWVDIVEAVVSPGHYRSGKPVCRRCSPRRSILPQGHHWTWLFNSQIWTVPLVLHEWPFKVGKVHTWDTISHIIILVKSSTSNWDRDDDPLENHVVTFEDFIKLARVYKRSKSQWYFDLFNRFFPYLVTSSTQKMRWRISYWVAQGFIYSLGKVDESRLRDVVSATMPSLQNDSNLSDRLLEMEDETSIQDIIMKNCQVVSAWSLITSPLSGCRAMQMLLRQEGWAKLHGVSSLYSKTTCFEFHQLLLATLLSYGKVLDGFVAALALHKSKPNFSDLIRWTDEVWICTSLLWSIAYSWILDNYLAILSTNGWLRVPSNLSYPIYSGFTTFSYTKDQTLTMFTDEDEECRNEEEEIKALSAGGEPFDLAEEDEGGGYEGEGINTDIMPDGQADLYWRWIRLQVYRWQATRKITTIFTNPGRPFLI